jgi:hypothetical protein
LRVGEIESLAGSTWVVHVAVVVWGGWAIVVVVATVTTLIKRHVCVEICGK